MIKCLSEDVRERLRSGVAVPSLQQCVEELVLNSIDAGATCVGVRMDMEAFKVQVIDNGSGMAADDMECVGNRYYTSKCSSVEDLEDLKWYGFRGEALASIVSLAKLVEVSSRTRLSVKTHVKLFKDGKGLNVFEAETVRPSSGTTVIICNFFHNMPVRRKRVDGVLEGERIRRRVEAISLMHPAVSFTMKNDCSGLMMVQLPKARNTYHRFVQIHGLARAEKLREISYTHKQFEVIGYLGTDGHYNNTLQYLYVNDRLMLKTRIHKLLNSLLRRLNSSNQNTESPDGISGLRSPKPKRNHEQFGVYMINIKCSYSEYDICLEPAKTLIEFKDWDSVLFCVEEAVKAFLRRENLSLFSQDELDSGKVFMNDKIDKEESGKDGPANIDISTLDCSVGMKLASEFVHRKRTDDGVCLESGSTACERDETKQLEDEGVCLYELKNSPLCDLNTVSSIINKEEDICFSEAGEGSNILHTNRQECGSSGDAETQLKDVPSTSDVSSPHNGIQPDLNCNKETTQSTDSQGQTFVCNSKISLSNIQKPLQTQDHSQTCDLVFRVQNLATKCQEKPSKRKITVQTDNDGASQKLLIPSKIPRVLSSQKLSASRELGSLDKFRRTFVESFKVKLPHPHSQDNSKLSQTDSFANNPEKIFCKDNLQEGQVTEAREDDRLQNPTTDQMKCKISVAAKLSHLKHHKPETVEVLKKTSEGKNSVIGSNEGAQVHNSQNPQEPGEHADPLLDCSSKDSTSGDWLNHYDPSAGRMVYINRMTGLSRYEDPTVMEETQVRCTSDVTNMAVSVISETGMEYRCYPFQVDLVLPFLPKSRPERVISTGIDCRDEAGGSSNSLSTLYSQWKNPVFVRPPDVGVDISTGQADGLAVKIHNILFPYRFSKAMIHSMKVIHQVDKKFLACLINTSDEDSAAHSESEGNLLVLVDQHAAHERVRLENLVTDSYENDPDVPGERRLCSSTILPPLEISVTEEELRLLRSCQPHLRSLGLEVTFSQIAAPLVFVGKVPLCFVEKERNELRRGRSSVIKRVVEEYLREQIELLRSTGRVKGTLPLTVLKVLASLACHGAIKFNDPLSREECCSLVASLSSCKLPFQCAHGRPSIVPLVDVLHLDKDQEVPKPNLQKLRRRYKAWELYGNK